MTLQPRRPLGLVLRATLTALTALAICGGAGRVSAATPADARATTIVQMLRFVEWPPDSGGGFTIAVVDDRTLGAALRQAYATIQPQRRDVTVVDVATPRALSGVRATVVVLGADAPSLARQLSNQGIVTVGNGDCPDEPSLTLNLLEPGGPYRFSANPAAAARAGVNLSSRLLRYAQITR